jgi:hypothetical protein
MERKEEGITKDLLSEVEVSSLESVDDPDETKEDVSEEQSLVDLTIGDNERSAEQDQDQDKAKEENYQGTLSSPINDYFLKESEDQNCKDGQHLRTETEEAITEKDTDYESYCGKRKREGVPHLPRNTDDNINVGQHEFLTTCATSASSSTSPSFIHIVTTALPQLENELKEMNYTIAQLKRSAHAIKSPRSVRLIDETLFDGNANGNEDIIKDVTIQQLTERNDQLENENLSLKQALITLAINRGTKENGNIEQHTKITPKKGNKEKTESAEFSLASEVASKNLSPEWTSQNIFLRSKESNCSGGAHLAKCSYCQKVFRVERLSMLTDHVAKCISIGPSIEKEYLNDLTKVASSLYFFLSCFLLPSQAINTKLLKQKAAFERHLYSKPLKAEVIKETNERHEVAESSEPHSVEDTNVRQALNLKEQRYEMTDDDSQADIAIVHSDEKHQVDASSSNRIILTDLAILQKVIITVLIYFLKDTRLFILNGEQGNLFSFVRSKSYRKKQLPRERRCVDIVSISLMLRTTPF